jgi:hypothetical protein
MAYIREIFKNTPDSHQTSPAYVLTIIRWNNRDTVNYNQPEAIVRKNFVVINDAINIEVNESKSSITGSLTVTLKAGDINYATAFAPGDYIVVNLLQDETKAIEVYNRASDGLSINRYDDGFKGVYKIQKIRRQIAVDPGSGQRMYQFTLHAFSFTELNSVIYFNPTAAASFAESKTLFVTTFSEWFNEKITSESNVQGILMSLTKALLGAGLNKGNFTMAISQNAQFIIPPSLAALLGKKADSTVVTDIYNFVYGVWKSGTGNTPASGFNPRIESFKDDPNFFVTTGGDGSILKGYNVLQVEDFNQKKIWSILQSYSNSAINESYTTNRVAKDGNVYPTVIFRQRRTARLLSY